MRAACCAAPFFLLKKISLVFAVCGYGNRVALADAERQEHNDGFRRDGILIVRADAVDCDFARVGFGFLCEVGTIRGVSLETLFKIAEALKIPPSRLLEDD